MTKRYYMKLPDTEIETFINYSKKVAMLFKNLTRGAHTETDPRECLPYTAYPYLYWFADSSYEDYIYYGHNKNFKNSKWIPFSLDNIKIGEL